MPRERYVNYSLADFHESYKIKKRKRESDDYAAKKKEMESALASYEAAASSAAVRPPTERKLPRTNGRQLANLVKHERSLLVPAVA